MSQIRPEGTCSGVADLSKRRMIFNFIFKREAGFRAFRIFSTKYFSDEYFEITFTFLVLSLFVVAVCHGLFLKLFLYYYVGLRAMEPTLL